MKKMFIAGLLALALPVGMASAQSTITGTLSSSGVVTTSSSSSLSGTVATSSSTGSLSGSVGGGSGSLTGTVVSPSTSGGGGGGGGGSNGPPVGGGGGGGPGTVIVCPNLPASLYTLPAGYEVVDGNCDPVGSVLGASTGPTTGTSVPGVPNTGAGGFAIVNLMELLLSGALALGGVQLLRRT